jgi:dUTP pyrophosphatase
MKSVARFERVSSKQFIKDFIDSFNVKEEEALKIYENIKLPKRATKFSAGYDFFLPIDLHLEPGKTIKIPTGIRAFIEDSYVLSLYPRSGLGFKYRMQLNNTVGIIDADYYNALNEGHIMIKITNDTNEGKVIDLKEGDAFAQGIFTEYFITYDDDSKEERIGGFGSTSRAD